MPKLVRDYNNASTKIFSSSSTLLKKITSGVSQKSEKLVDEHGITKTITNFSDSSKEVLSKIDDKLNISDQSSQLSRKVKETISILSQKISETGVKDKVDEFKHTLQENISKPISNYSEKLGSNSQLYKIIINTENVYGSLRSIIKPYYAPETPKELLEDTKKELIYINSCILQINADEAEKLANAFGTAVISKVAGATSIGLMFSIVGTYGTAGTGTAIASLSGAAATNATLAWVGGLLGGGMATGAAVTGGLALAVGVGVYKLISSDARKYEQLSDEERHIIDSSSFMIALINEILEKKDIHIDAYDAQIMLDNTLRPLHQFLIDESNNITNNLDNKNSLLYRQHAITDFKNQVIDGFEFFINESQKTSHINSEYVIGGVIYALLSNSVVDDSDESQIALQAIKRLKSNWHDASESELSAALSEYEPEQLKGIANNIKGIYHELLFVDSYNKTHKDTYAVLFGETNHPGADIQIKFVSDDKILREIQLKATNSSSYVEEHINRYPNIEVLVTNEVTSESNVFESSGISNQKITDNIDDILNKISSNSITDRAFESMEYAGLATIGKEAIDILRGNKTGSISGKKVVNSALIASSSTLIASYLFS